MVCDTKIKKPSLVMSAPALSFYTLLFISSCQLVSSFLCFINRYTLIIEWEISNIANTPLLINLIIDDQGLFLSSIIVFISSIVIGFSKTYIQGDPHTTRFISLVIIFVLSINLLIFIPNIIVILIGWDGLGVVSFLLVIYYSNPSSLRAGIITVLTNRLGDGLILIRIAWLIRNRHWCIPTLWKSEFATPIIISILLAACTKRAQIPFSTWLPAAIAAPTPVSALVHSSTLVTAGVFLLTRFYPFLNEIQGFKTILMIISVATILIAGIGAAVEPDLKKIIALSTLRQLGVIIARISIGLPIVALFHLITHALFKALLFVCAGTIIFINCHRQDLRTTGRMYTCPLTTTAFFIANISLCGTPFLAAFYSKDILLEIYLFSPVPLLTLIVVFVATSFTSAYTTRFIINLLWAPPTITPLNSLNEEVIFFSTPIILLTTGAILGGAALNWLLICPSIPTPLPTFIKLLTIIVTLLGALLAITLSCYPESLTKNFKVYLWANLNMWALSPISKQAILAPALNTRFKLTHTVDQGWQEILGGQGMFNLVQPIANKIVLAQNNLISTQLILSTTFIFILILNN